MASQVTGWAGQIEDDDGTLHALGSTAYGYCQTAAATAAKVVDMTGFKLVTGATIFVKFQYANNVANPTLNVNGTGAKPIYRYGTTRPSTNTSTNGWSAGAVLAFTYDGSGWQEHYWYNNQYRDQGRRVRQLYRRGRPRQNGPVRRGGNGLEAGRQVELLHVSRQIGRAHV